MSILVLPEELLGIIFSYSKESQYLLNKKWTIHFFKNTRYKFLTNSENGTTIMNTGPVPIFSFQFGNIFQYKEWVTAIEIQLSILADRLTQSDIPDFFNFPNLEEFRILDINITHSSPYTLDILNTIKEFPKLINFCMCCNLAGDNNEIITLVKEMKHLEHLSLHGIELPTDLISYKSYESLTSLVFDQFNLEVSPVCYPYITHLKIGPSRFPPNLFKDYFPNLIDLFLTTDTNDLIDLSMTQITHLDTDLVNIIFPSTTTHLKLELYDFEASEIELKLSHLPHLQRVEIAIEKLKDDLDSKDHIKNMIHLLNHINVDCILKVWQFNLNLANYKLEKDKESSIVKLEDGIYLGHLCRTEQELSFLANVLSIGSIQKGA